MASYSQPPFFSSLIPIKNKTFATSNQPKNFITFKSLKISSAKLESSPESQPDDEVDPVKLAFAKAKAYRNSIGIVQSPSEEPTAGVSGKNNDSSILDEVKDANIGGEVPLAVRVALEKATEYKESKVVAENEGGFSKMVQNPRVGSAEIEEKSDGVESDGGGKEIPLAVKLALEKAKEYKKEKGGVDSDTTITGFKGGNENDPRGKQWTKNSGKKGELTVSSLDFVGLGFADKKSGRGLPAGLVPQSDPFPEGKLPEVEILVGDSSKFGDTLAAPKAKESDADLYKPKVSTWGVFPRPNNISETYGGGRTIRPGDTLETAEEKAAKEARTRQLLAAYKKKTGLNIDPKLKSECEKEIKDGDSLMDLGNLKEAIPFYERVMEKLAFESELHGLAALQRTICLDSLGRSNEARTMYEKLQTHPSPRVNKKARQFFYSFQAMEMMKVKSMSRSPRSTGYQNYFDAFVQDKTNYPLEEAEEDEGGLSQAVAYVILVVSPILMVLLMAAFRSK